VRGTPDPDDGLSIGALAEQSGVAVETIRAWERRYGRPAPMRRPSGHRRYRAAEVDWLRRVAHALALGGRPRDVVRAAPRRLAAILAADPASGAGAAWIDAARALDGDALRRRLRRAARRLSATEFVGGVAGPLAAALGRAWAERRISVRHEHLATSVLLEELRRLRADSAPRRGAVAVVLATLPGERHSIGIEMAAVVAAHAGARCVLLGADAPLEEIAASAADTGAAIVAISVSQNYGKRRAARALADLRARLSEGVHLVAGGAGSRRHGRETPGLARIEDFAEFGRLVSDVRVP
jgi:methylmalonyl-CoA mutase cobalamin-binding subunit